MTRGGFSGVARKSPYANVEGNPPTFADAPLEHYDGGWSDACAVILTVDVLPGRRHVHCFSCRMRPHHRRREDDPFGADFPLRRAPASDARPPMMEPTS